MHQGRWADLQIINYLGGGSLPLAAASSAFGLRCPPLPPPGCTPSGSSCGTRNLCGGTHVEQLYGTFSFLRIFVTMLLCHFLPAWAPLVSRGLVLAECGLKQEQ